jgi:hypothetical protein
MPWQAGREAGRENRKMQKALAITCAAAVTVLACRSVETTPAQAPAATGPSAAATTPPAISLTADNLWEPLQRRPNQIPTSLIAPGQCSIEPAKEVADRVWGLGTGPYYPVISGVPPHGVAYYDAAHAGPDGWFPIKTLWLASDSFGERALIRGAGIEPPGEVRFSSGNGTARSLELRFPEGSTGVAGIIDPAWRGREWPSLTWVKGPGCYAFQVDSPSWSYAVVFEVRAAP